MIARLLLPSLLLIGCQTGEPDPSGKSAGALRRCIGEAAYSKESWNQVVKDLAAHPMPCLENQAADGDIMAMLNLEPGREAGAGDSVELHGFAMDASCDPVAEYRRTVPLAPGRVGFVPLWDGRNDYGSLVPTGEHYVNLEIEWKDGSRDTSYQKIGYVRNGCPDTRVR